MATAPLILPPPASNAGNNWQKAWKAYQADPIGGYAAYYNFLKGGSTGGPLLAAGNYPPPGSAGAPTSQNPGGTASTPPPSTGYTGVGSHPNPPSGILMAPGLPESQQNPSLLSRFGDYNLDPYAIGTSYAPGAGLLPQQAPPVPASGGPSGAPAAPLPAPAPPTPTTPAPAPQPVPAPVPGAAGQPSGQGNGGGGFGGQGNAGNAGGAEGNHGGFGAPSSGGSNTQGNAAGANGSTTGTGGQPAGFFNFGPNQAIDLGPWGAGLLSAAATAAPFPYGTAIGAVQAAMRGYNLANGDAVRTSLGAQPQDFGQILGGLLNLNDRGSLSGNQTFFNREENKDVNGHPVAVTQGGYYDPGFLQRLFTGDQEGTAYTPEEKRVRDLAAPRGNAGGATNSAGGFLPDRASQIAMGAPSGTLSQTGVAPAISLRDQQKAAAELALYNAKNGYTASGGMQSNGAQGNNAPSNLGGGTMSNPGGGTTAPGSAGTGGLNNGFGGGGYMRGGFVPGRPDNIPDNHRGRLNEGELILNNQIVGLLGPNAGLLNNPAVAKRVRGLLS